MSDSETNARMDTLEDRFTHQEAALDELTRVVLRQEDKLRMQAEIIERLQLQLGALSSESTGTPQDDTPPPHY